MLSFIKHICGSLLDRNEQHCYADLYTMYIEYVLFQDSFFQMEIVRKLASIKCIFRSLRITSNIILSPGDNVIWKNVPRCSKHDTNERHFGVFMQIMYIKNSNILVLALKLILYTVYMQNLIYIYKREE